MFKFPDAGVAMSMYNLDQSIIDFARASMNYGWRASTRSTSRPSTFSRSMTAFKDLFQKVYEEEFVAKFKALGLTYEHRLIDDMVASCLKWSAVRLGLQELRRRRAVRYGRAGLRLPRPDDLRADDAGRPDRGGRGATRHVTRHYREHQKGRETSTNSIASIFAWTRGLSTGPSSTATTISPSSPRPWRRSASTRSRRVT